MYGRDETQTAAPSSLRDSDIDWSRYRLTRGRVLIICCVLLTITIGVSIHQFSQAKDNILPGGAPVGGDYVAFYGASIAAKTGQAPAIYDHQEFEQVLLQVGPPRDNYRLTWQYPPTYFLLIAPLALLPFVPGYLVWSAGTAALYLTTLRRSGFSFFFLFALLASPSFFHAFITGQNGFLTAMLLAIAALCPDKRPLFAGIAAALLTVKPQIGVLLPIAYIAGGHWRAFITAAIGAVALAALATGVYGTEIWHAFLSGATATSGRLEAGVLPIFKMITPFAWARYAGAPTFVAAALHALFTVLALAIVWRVWRRVPDRDLKAATLCAGVFMVAPYGLYYEMVILALPVAILAKRAVEKGWLPLEQVALAVMYIGPMAMPGSRQDSAISWGFPVAVLIAAGVMRRIEAEYPDTFGFTKFPQAVRYAVRQYTRLSAPKTASA